MSDDPRRNLSPRLRQLLQAALSARQVRDWGAHRRARELLKAEVQAAHDAAPDSYLSAPLPLDRREAPYLEPIMPIEVRRAAVRANYLVRDFRLRELRNKSRRRPHRKTGGRKGPLIDDSGLAVHADRLVREWHYSPAEAEQLMVELLAWAEPIETETARARVRRAMGRLRSNRDRGFF